MSTQTYCVTIAMNPCHSARVMIEAESADQANDRALEQARTTQDFTPSFELDEDSIHSAEIYLPDPDSTEPCEPEPDHADPATQSDSEDFYFCTITEVNGEHEYLSRFLVKCGPNETIDDRLTEILHDFRGEADPDPLPTHGPISTMARRPPNRPTAPSQSLSLRS